MSAFDIGPFLGDMVVATRPDPLLIPSSERNKVGIVVEIVPPGGDNIWAIDMFRVLWTGPNTGGLGQRTLEPEHRLRIIGR